MALPILDENPSIAYIIGAFNPSADNTLDIFRALA